MKKFFLAITSWSNLEFIPLKLCIGSAYLLLGAIFHEWVMDHHILISFIFGLTAAISLRSWVVKMKRSYTVEA